MNKMKIRTKGLTYSRFTSLLVLLITSFFISALIMACQPKKKFEFHTLPESSSPASASFSFTIAPIYKPGTSEKKNSRFLFTAQKWIYPEIGPRQKSALSTAPTTESSPVLKSNRHEIVLSKSKLELESESTIDSGGHEDKVEVQLSFENHSINYKFKPQDLQKLKVVDFFYEQLTYRMGVLCRDETCDTLRLCFLSRIPGRFAAVAGPFETQCSVAWEFKLAPDSPLESDSAIKPDAYHLKTHMFSKRDKNGNLVEDAIKIDQCKSNPTSLDSSDLEAACYHY